MLLVLDNMHINGFMIILYNMHINKNKINTYCNFSTCRH